MIAYWIERFPARVFVPVAAALALLARSRGFEPVSWAAGTLSALLLLAQFRLWDDLADRERDRSTHPDRVLVRAQRAGPFVALCLLLAAANILSSSYAGKSALALCLLLNCAAAAWYAWRPSRRTATGDLLVLVKYPVFVVLLGTTPTAPFAEIAFSALAVYAAACAFELWHDASSPLRLNNS